jgi:hypothetical protein
LSSVTPSVSGIQISSSTRSGAPCGTGFARLLGVSASVLHVLRRSDFREQLADTHFIVHYQNVCHLPLPSSFRHL